MRYAPAAVSIVSLVLTLVLWRRSHQLTWDVICWQRAGGISYCLISKDDQLTAMCAQLRDPDAPTGLIHWVDINAALTKQNNPTFASHMGLVSEPTSVPRQWPNGGLGSERVPARSIAIPYWLLAILFAIAPARSVIVVLKRRRRRQKGCCVICGYDLRASKDRCPECGMPISSAIRAN